MRKEIERCVEFAKFCILHDLEPWNLGELMDLKTKAHNMYLRWNNPRYPTATFEQVEKAQNTFDLKAEPYGFVVEWNSIVPTLYKDGQMAPLPF